MPNVLPPHMQFIPPRTPQAPQPLEEGKLKKAALAGAMAAGLAGAAAHHRPQVTSADADKKVFGTLKAPSMPNFHRPQVTSQQADEKLFGASKKKKQESVSTRMDRLMTELG